MKARTLRYFTIADVTLLPAFILWFIWQLQFTARWTWIVFVVWMLLSFVLHHDTPKTLGWRADNLWPATRQALLFFGAMILGLLAIGAAFGSPLRLPPNLISWHRLWSYFAFCVLQQVLLNSLVHNRMLSLVSRQWVAAFLTGLIFAACHWPNPVLVPLTLIGGSAMAWMFGKQRNIIPLAIGQAILGSIIFWAFPVAWHHHLRVGPGYYSSWLPVPTRWGGRRPRQQRNLSTEGWTETRSSKAQRGKNGGTMLPFYRSRRKSRINADRRSAAMQHSQLSDGRDRFDRRAFCKAAGVAAAVGVVEASLGSGLAHADLTKEQRDKMTPGEIIQQMKAGNERFRSGKPQHRDLMREAKATAKGQYPAAIVFSCVDSRAPAELILDYGIGDIFSGRVAGNIADEDIMGSMEFACKVAGSKVVLVMGHTACGAIKGAIDDVQLGNLTALLAKIRPAVEATQYTGERSAKNYAFVDAVARKNVLLTIANIREKSPVLRDLESSGSIKIAGSMYNLETGTVEFLE